MARPLASVAEEVHEAAWNIGRGVAAVAGSVGVQDGEVVAGRARTDPDLRMLMGLMEAACKSLAAFPLEIRQSRIPNLVIGWRKSIGCGKSVGR